MDILIEEFEENIWVAALEKGRLEGLEVDPIGENVRWGSIYWAKVTRIDTKQDAVFLDLDGDHEGILYNKDVRYHDKDGNVKKGGERAISKTLHAGDMIAVQAKSTYIEQGDDSLWGHENKATQTSMDITLPGRYLIFGAMMKNNRISSRIRGKKQREQMLKMIDALEDMKGFILRSAAADMQTEILRREANILKNIWLQIEQYFEGKTPSLIALGPDSIQRTLSDKAMNPIERIEIVTMDHFSQVEDWCTVFAPDLVTKITPIELEDAAQDLALFDHRDILGQIESLLHDYVMLQTGSNIIVQETTALTAIDVNSSSDKRSHLSINIDAAKEIARQMRLRNLGGIVIIDFLKMNKADEKTLLNTLNDQTYLDPCTVQIHGFTKLGLMEITRKRRTAPLLERFEGIEF